MKYEEGSGGWWGQIDPPPGKTTLKKPSLIRVNAEQLEVLGREQQLKEQLTRRKNDKTDGENRALAKPQAFKLQRDTITPFEGDYKDWLHFWNIMSEISNFNYLLELVEGKQKEEILGLPHSTEGYAEA